MNKRFFMFIKYLGKIFAQIYEKIAIFVGFKRKKMKKTLFYAFLLLMVVAAVSCKKKSEETTPSLSGLSIISDYDNFMGEGCTVTARADVSGLVASDGSTPEKVGIYFYFGDVRDTVTRDVKVSNPSFSVTIDEAGTHTLLCYAFAGDKYYNTSASISFTVLNPETAITGRPDQPYVEVAGNKFYTTEIEGKTWMTNNLYGTNSGRYYQDSEILASVFGQYYSWEEAQGACPNGWHLPTEEEFDSCLGEVSGDLMVNAKFVDREMWSYWPDVKITNKFEFNALPVGYLDYTLEDVPETGYLEYACFWTQGEEDDFGLFRYIFEEYDTVQQGKGDKNTLYLSVRCVKD